MFKLQRNVLHVWIYQDPQSFIPVEKEVEHERCNCSCVSRSSLICSWGRRVFFFDSLFSSTSEVSLPVFRMTDITSLLRFYWINSDSINLLPRGTQKRIWGIVRARNETKLLLLKNIALKRGSNFERDFLAILYLLNRLLVNFTVHGEAEKSLLSNLEGKIPVQVASGHKTGLTALLCRFYTLLGLEP